MDGVTSLWFCVISPYIRGVVYTSVLRIQDQWPSNQQRCSPSPLTGPPPSRLNIGGHRIVDALHFIPRP